MQCKYEVLRLLKDVSTGKYRLYGFGICWLLTKNMGYSSKMGAWLEKAIEEWPGATGQPNYVVGHPTLTPCEAYLEFSCRYWCMNGRSPYGMQRRKLAKYLYTKLKETDEF
jgi:hypothetical protein